MMFNTYSFSANDLRILNQTDDAFSMYCGGTLVQISAGTLDIQAEVFHGFLSLQTNAGTLP
jgi:hypothetical protein